MHVRVGIFYLAGFPLTIVYTTQRDMLIKERKEEGGGRAGWRERRRKLRKTYLNTIKIF